MWKLILVGLLLGQNRGGAEGVLVSPSEEVDGLRTWGRNNPRDTLSQRTWQEQPSLIQHNQEVWLGEDTPYGFIKMQFVATIENGAYKTTYSGSKLQKEADGSIRLTSSRGWIHFIPTDNPKIFRPRAHTAHSTP